MKRDHSSHAIRQPDITIESTEQVPPSRYTQERFVPAAEAAYFLGINRRLLLSMARRGLAGAYAIGTGEMRKTWIFRLSELARAIDPASRNERFPGLQPSGSGYDPIIGRSSLK